MWARRVRGCIPDETVGRGGTDDDVCCVASVCTVVVEVCEDTSGCQLVLLLC